MHPAELWWLFESKMPPKRYGSLAESEIAEIYESLKSEGAI